MILNVFINMYLPAGQNRPSGPANVVKFLFTGTVSSSKVRCGGWSASWFVPVSATEDSKSKDISLSGCGYSIGVHSDADFKLL